MVGGVGVGGGSGGGVVVQSLTKVRPAFLTLNKFISQ